MVSIQYSPYKSLNSVSNSNTPIKLIKSLTMAEYLKLRHTHLEQQKDITNTMDNAIKKLQLIKLKLNNGEQTK